MNRSNLKHIVVLLVVVFLAGIALGYCSKTELICDHSTGENCMRVDRK